VILLRAVNVGGSANRVSNAVLAALCARPPLNGTAVKTYVNSGNAVFSSSLSAAAAAVAMHDLLDDELSLDITVLCRSASDLRAVLASSPYPSEDATTGLHVAFLASAAPADGLARLSALDFGADGFTPSDDGRHLYLHYADGTSGRSKLTGAVVEKTLGVGATCRNWRTVRKLVELCDAGA
jgi:uncharacterized protein (DUF1697 family)